MFDRLIMWLSHGDQMSNYRAVVKATGRLKYQNIRRVSIAIPETRRFVQARFSPDLVSVDTRFLIAAPAIFCRLFEDMGSSVAEDSGNYIEHVAAHRILDGIRHGDADWIRFRVTPAVDGFSGSNGTVYGGLNRRLKDLVADRVNSTLSARYL
jgi:hypothetical protein